MLAVHRRCITHSLEFTVGALSDTTVAIFMPKGVEIINKKKTL